MYFGGRSCDLHILLLCHLQPPSKIIFFEKIHMFPKMWIKKEDSLGFSKFLRWKNHFQIFYMSNFCSWLPKYSIVHEIYFSKSLLLEYQPLCVDWLHACACSVAQSCLTLYNPVDYNQPGSSIYGILQARILEWDAISSFKGSSWPRYQTHISCITGVFFTTELPGKPVGLLGPL